MGFTQKSNLERHKKVHNGEKDFECKECSKKFSAKANLQQHEEIHKD